MAGVLAVTIRGDPSLQSRLLRGTSQCRAALHYGTSTHQGCQQLQDRTRGGSGAGELPRADLRPCCPALVLAAAAAANDDDEAVRDCFLLGLGARRVGEEVALEL
jgi:hypothetical protein